MIYMYIQNKWFKIYVRNRQKMEPNFEKYNNVILSNHFCNFWLSGGRPNVRSNAYKLSTLDKNIM